MALWTVGIGALGAAIGGILLANTNVLMPKPESASLPYLSAADLRSLDQVNNWYNALWDARSQSPFYLALGDFCCIFLQEAAEISSLRPQFDELGVKLYAVVKENIETELEAFQPYFKGEIFLDVNKRFYGPRERVLGLVGLVRLSVLRNLFQAWRKGFSGNTNGEGFILGGVFVVGPGEQGVLLEHREKEFGDCVDIQSLLDAVGKIKPQNETKSES